MLLLAILVFMPHSPSLRVLLIEDSALLAARLIELVNGLPDVELIDTVDTEADALDRISEVSPDVLILDLHLREGSGFGVLRSLALSTRPRPKIIVLTNFGLPEYIVAKPSYSVSRHFSTRPASTSGCRRC